MSVRAVRVCWKKEGTTLVRGGSMAGFRKMQGWGFWGLALVEGEEEKISVKGLSPVGPGSGRR